MTFAVGDYIFGMLVGVVTALAVRAIVWPGMDMVVAMLIGMGVGFVLHMVLSLACQSASKVDPRSASNCDPTVLACAGSP
jgi:hypothetical protein